MITGLTSFTLLEAIVGPKVPHLHTGRLFPTASFLKCGKVHIEKWNESQGLAVGILPILVGVENYDEFKSVFLFPIGQIFAVLLSPSVIF